MQRIHLTNYKKKHTQTHTFPQSRTGLIWLLVFASHTDLFLNQPALLRLTKVSRLQMVLVAEPLVVTLLPSPEQQGRNAAPTAPTQPQHFTENQSYPQDGGKKLLLPFCVLSGFLPSHRFSLLLLLIFECFLLLSTKFHTSGSLTQCNSTSSLANFPVAGNHSPLRCACVWAISPTPASDVTPERWGGACRCASACSCKDRPTSSRLKIEPEEPVWSAVTTHTDTHTW